MQRPAQNRRTRVRDAQVPALAGGFALARRQTGKDPLPGRLLAHFPKGAFGAGMLELCAADARDLESDDGARLLAIARITASAVAGCPFCVDMNAATWQRAGLGRDELVALLSRDDAGLAALALEPRAALTVRYAAALSARWGVKYKPHKRHRDVQWSVIGFVLDEKSEMYLRKLAQRRIDWMRRRKEEGLQQRSVAQVLGR